MIRAIRCAVLAGACVLVGLPASAQLRPQFQRAADATVLIEATWEIRGRYAGREAREFVDSNGSGFLIAPHGIIITNNHVVDPAYVEDQVKAELPELARLVDFRVRRTKLTVRALSGTDNELKRPGSVVRRDRKNDLAIMSVNFGRDLPYLRIAKTCPLRMGASIAVAGFPANSVMRSLVKDRGDRGTAVTVSQGRVTAIRRDRKKRARILQVDAAIVGGNSGGPVVDGRGVIVGVLSSTVGGGVNFAIASDTVYEFAENYIPPADRAPDEKTPPKPEATTSQPMHDTREVIVYLKNGGRERGLLKRRTNDAIVLKLPGLGTMTYKLSEISRIERVTE